jgi:hypothetical protein
MSKDAWKWWQWKAPSWWFRDEWKSHQRHLERAHQEEHERTRRKEDEANERTRWTKHEIEDIKRMLIWQRLTLNPDPVKLKPEDAATFPPNDLRLGVYYHHVTPDPYGMGQFINQFVLDYLKLRYPKVSTDHIKVERDQSDPDWWQYDHENQLKIVEYFRHVHGRDPAGYEYGHFRERIASDHIAAHFGPDPITRVIQQGIYPEKAFAPESL